MAIPLITENQRYLKTRVAGVNGLPVVAGDVNPIITAVNDLTDGSITTTTLALDGTTDSTSTITGTLTVAGGVGIAKALYVSTTTPASISNTGVLSVTNATDSTTSTTGAVKVTGGLGVAKAIFGGSTINATTNLTAGSVVTSGVGAVGATSYGFTGRTNQGMYSVSSTQVGFSSGAAGLTAVVDASGLSADSLRARVAAGTTPVGTVAIVEYSDGRDVLVELTLTNFIVGALAGAGANLGIGNIVYAYPAGQHLELVYSLSSIVLTCAGTAVATDTGLGSVIASGAVAVLSGTGTFEDRLTGQTINTAVGGGAAVSAITAATAGIGTGIALNGTGDIKNVFLNSAGTWNADNTGNLTASGKIYLKYSRM